MTEGGQRPRRKYCFRFFFRAKSDRPRAIVYIWIPNCRHVFFYRGICITRTQPSKTRATDIIYIYIYSVAGSVKYTQEALMQLLRSALGRQDELDHTDQRSNLPLEYLDHASGEGRDGDPSVQRTAVPQYTEDDTTQPWKLLSESLSFRIDNTDD